MLGTGRSTGVGLGSRRPLLRMHVGAYRELVPHWS